MQTDLSIRVRVYTAAAQAEVPSRDGVHAEALACSHAAAAAVSAGLICSHSRILRGDSPPDYLRPGQDELDFLVADRPSRREDPPGDQMDSVEAKTRPPLRLDKIGSVDTLASGAVGIRIIKSQNG